MLNVVLEILVGMYLGQVFSVSFLRVTNNIEDKWFLVFLIPFIYIGLIFPWFRSYINFVIGEE